MEPYLVDVPVRVCIWIRPECQRRQFEVIRQAKPSILFLQSDGGRNETEWSAIRKNRRMYDTEINWECQVYRLYEETNLGLYTMGKKVSEFIWEKVDRCIFLEDDHLPSVSFFKYCAELLEKYKDDLRVARICGMNHLGVSDNVTADYFFSRQGSIWGTATWKRSFEMRDNDFSYAGDPYAMSILEQRARHNPIFLRRAKAYAKQKYYEGHIAGGEFWLEYEMYAQNQLVIIPKENQISCIGATKDSAHSDALDVLPKGLRRAFNIPVHELKFPLKHPCIVAPDVKYEIKRNKIMAYNTPLRSFYRKFERGWYKLLRGDFKYIIKKIWRRKNEQ